MIELYELRDYETMNAGDRVLAFGVHALAWDFEQMGRPAYAFVPAEGFNPELLKMCATALSALKSYQYGNSSPELAEEVAAEIEVLINKIRR